jgi:uncharacterized membrane protein YhaH (DUF805 family)
MFKSKKQEYWFWMILFLINMMTFFVFMQGDNGSFHAGFSIIMMALCFGKGVSLAGKLDDEG